MKEITALQLAELEAYDSLEPIGGFRQDYRFAQVCDLIYQLAQAIYAKRGRKRRTTPLDFMPWGDGCSSRVRSKKKKQSVDEMKEILYAIAGAAKADVRKR